MNNKNLSIDINGLKLNNPVIAASGTFGFGREYSEFVDLNKIGGICVKGLTLKPRPGNKPPRIVETPAGIINSVGLQNPGVEAFIEKEIPFLRKHNTSIIVNIAGNSIEDYCDMAKILSDADIDAIELNISCPNVKEGCLDFGKSAGGTRILTSRVREHCKKPLIVKLTPNVTDVREIAIAAEESGADAISLINTLLGMAIDIHKRRPVLANNVGGLSGPAIKPVALRMVYEVASIIKIPVIGMGGITCGEDAVEFMLAGASAVMVGTHNFVNPTACVDVLEGIEKYMEMYKINDVNELRGKLELN